MKQTSIVKEMGTLLSGNILAQLIAMAAYFALTRIFSPEDFGLYNIFYSYIEVLIILSTCKYELAIVVSSDDEEATAVSRFALRLNTVVSLILLTIALILWLTGTLPSYFAALGWLVLLIPPMVFFCGTSRVYMGLFNRWHRYGVLATSETVNAGAAATIKVLLGLLGTLQSGLPVGTVLGRAVANLVYRLKLKQLQLPTVTHNQTLVAAHKHRNFPLFVGSKDLINSLSGNLPFLWLAMYFDSAEVGLFGLALTFTFRPVNLLNGVFERVLYARTAEAVRERRSIKRMIGHFLLSINAVALPAAVLAWFVAEPVFVFCFGERWSGCTPYVRALLPWVFMMLSSTSLMFISNVFGTQKTEFLFYIALLLLRVVAIAFGVHSGNFLTAIRLYAAAGVVVTTALLVWYLWQVRRHERSLQI